jgi:hypothetical protein
MKQGENDCILGCVGADVWHQGKDERNGFGKLGRRNFHSESTGKEQMATSGAKGKFEVRGTKFQGFEFSSFGI